MKSIRVVRYQQPVAGWAGYVEPEDLAWIAFIDLEGKPLLFQKRDPVTGAVV